MRRNRRDLHYKNAHYSKDRPYSLKLDVGVCPGDNGTEYSLYYPTIEGSLPLDGNMSRNLKNAMQNEIGEIFMVGEKMNRTSANQVKRANIQVSI